MTKLPLTNRDFKLADDRWFQITPIGIFDHPTGVKQVIDKNALESMVNRFKTEAAAPNFPGLLVDFDHFSNDPSRPTTAAGWIDDLQNRDDGLWAHIKFSDLGEKALTGGRYRLASPVWNRSDCDQWKAADADGKEQLHIRPLRLDRVALTNDPNLPDMVPLSNRREETPVAEPPVRLAAVKRQAVARNSRRPTTLFDGHAIPLAAIKRR